MLATVKSEQGEIRTIIDNMESFQESKKALVLYCYGLNGERSDRHRMPIKLSKRLHPLDIAVMRFDYIGLGISDGEFYNTTLQTKVRDILAVMRFVEMTMPRIEKFFFLGFSDGVSAALASIAKYTGMLKITGVLLWSPLLHMDIGDLKSENRESSPVSLQTAVAQNGKRSSASVPNRNRPIVKGDAIAIPAFGLWKNIRYSNLDDARIIRSYCQRAIPTCIVCPEEDYRVIPTAKQLEIRLGDKLVLHTIPGADHTFNRSTWENDAIVHSINWLRSLTT